MQKLFAVVLGGRAAGCNIELHDVVFVISDSIDNAYPLLVNKWFGITKRLHLDSYIELNHVDGHDIVLNNDKPKNKKKLYFVNFGSYKANHFGEIHESAFYIGTSKTEILARAKQALCIGGIEPHCDDNVAVDDVIALNKIDQYYIHFLPSAAKEVTIVSDYRRLDLAHILAAAQTTAS